MAGLEFKPRQLGPPARVSPASESQPPGSRGFMCSVYWDGAPGSGPVSVCGVSSYSAPDTHTPSLPPFTSFTAHTEQLLLCREGWPGMLGANGCHWREPGQTAGLAAGHWPRVQGGFRAKFRHEPSPGPRATCVRVGAGAGRGRHLETGGPGMTPGGTREGAAEPFLQAWAPKPFPGQPSMLSLVSSFGEW